MAKTGSGFSGICLNGQQSHCWWRLIKTNDLPVSNSYYVNLSTDISDESEFYF
jgi:hypothetical protein